MEKKLKEQEQKITELTNLQQDQLRQINLLFDEKASDYQQIDFNGLHSLLKQVAERERERESKINPPPIYSRKRKEKK